MERIPELSSDNWWKVLMDEMTEKVLGMFARFGKETLDLHELFEAGGNNPEARTAVFDTVERLTTEGLLEERGNDFYALTEAGKAASRMNAPLAKDEG